jgi:hypothetical protein
MEATIYTGASVGLKPETPWLAGEDLNGKPPAVVEIEQVLIYGEVPFAGGRKEKNVPALKLKGAKKQLVLRTGTNRKTLVAMFGTDTSKWVGQKIALYYEPNVKMKGELVGGIRITEAK